MKRTLGTCYYPEHWDPSIWEQDAARMKAAGLTWVRIGEFAWSRIEPQPGTLNWNWLDQAIETLGRAGLSVVLGTPTATPPRWIINKHPDMLPVGANGSTREFGSRRHYCFSHLGYREECRRITTLLAERYGKNPYVAAWQTDNEYGCHDSTLSYSPSALIGFRKWLAERYGTIDALNEAWGNVFWSMEYAHFDEIGLPNLTVTEPNPSHDLAFRRYTSDQVVAFNRLQVEAIRANSVAPIAHNYMGRITDFDHYAVGADLDIASWDSYPLGFLEDRVGATEQQKREFSRQGDPDFQAFHHDLYRTVGRGRWWIMEQQPGPVNWAPHNPAPLPGMVRVWTWEAFAHGAEAVCYFRWRQAPFAQEQMHAGLLRPDHADAPAMAEAQQVSAELADAPDVQPKQASVALLFDYDADAAWTVQPQGHDLSYFGLVFDTYRALRRLGLSIDILPPDALALDGYKMILAPGLLHVPDTLKSALTSSDAQVVCGPRTASKTTELSIPTPLPPAIPEWDVTISHVESLRPNTPVALKGGGAFVGWREFVVGQSEILETTSDGHPAVLRKDNMTYLAGWPDRDTFVRLLAPICDAADLDAQTLPGAVRCRDTGSERFWFNFSTQDEAVGGRIIPAVSVVREMRSL